MAIVLTDISKSYGDLKVFENFNYTFEDGGSYCIMGYSGKGKTTLLHMLMGILQPDSGTITGIDRSNIAPVFQEDRLIESISVGTNIRLAAHTKLESAAVKAALKRIGLPSNLRNPTKRLSGGMKRRVAILRALMSGGSVLLFDEPFKGLDEDTKRLTMDCVLSEAEGKTLIWVSHDTGEAQYMGSHIVNLDK